MILPLPTPGTEPSSQPQQTDVLRLAAGLVIAAILIAALYFGQVVLIPLAVAFLISFVLGPLVQWLVRHGLSRILAVALAMGLVLSVLGALGTVVAVQVRSLSAELPTYQSTIRAKIKDLGAQMEGPGFLEGALQTVDTVQQEVAEVVGDGDENDIAPQRVRVIAEPVSPFATAMLWLSPLLAPVATAGIVLVFVVLILLDQGDLRDRLLRMLGGNIYRSTDALEEASKRISKYLLMQLVVNVTYAIPMALGLWAIGVPGWILWGTLAAVMRFIPYVGPILSAVFPLSLAFAVDPGWNMVLMTAGLILVLELVSNNIIEPLLYGTSTGLSVLSLIAAATFWTAIWGPIGLVLSTPLTVCLLVVGRYIPQLSILETLLGSSPALSRETRIYQRLIANDPDDAIDIAEDVIEEESVTEFYNDEGMEVLRQASIDYINNARAEHRLRIANGMDELLEHIRGEYPADLPEGAAPRVACIAGKWEIDRQACEMLAHSLQLDGLPAVVRAAGSVTSRYVAGLELEGVQVVLLSFFSREPDAAARNLTRRIRARWPDVKVVLGLWGVPADALDKRRREALGADAVVASIKETVGRIALLAKDAAGAGVELVQDPQAATLRNETLRGVKLEDPDLREDLNDYALRAADVFDMKTAVIVALEGDHELVIGASRDLPGARTTDGRDLILLPAGAPLSAGLLADAGPLMVPDIERDPRLSENQILHRWSARALAAAPVRQADGVVLGALCLIHDEVRELDDEELRLLETLAAEVAERLTGEEAAPISEPQKPAVSATIGQKVPE
ncbi:AI-2E family transporter [Paracoccus sp. (in: a-proteobacteria)]|uniref:AI-2E family transporter n=1 Tax=Paracoccus sp. TaxID=267 RepID=UPI0026E07A91|nr:AI-2E family transporter [Paracoccus sp. (in: a-proteobacteria)]MDO5369080.1 AI-2E family transporter [Paracoccus sp. (in: a-proteobacteria)]